MWSEDSAYAAIKLLIGQSDYGDGDKRGLIDFLHHNATWCELGWDDPRLRDA